MGLRVFLGVSIKNQSCWHLNFKTSGSQNCERKCSTVLSHPVHGHLLQQPEEINTRAPSLLNGPLQWIISACSGSGEHKQGSSHSDHSVSQAHGRLAVGVEAGVFHPWKWPLSQAGMWDQGRALDLSLGLSKWGLLILCYTGLFFLWYRWAEVQSENVWGCSFPSTNPPCIALRCKLTRGASLVVTAVVQSLSHVQLFATPWTAARQASLSFTISWSLFKLMSIKSVMPSNHPVLCHPLLLLPSIFPSIRIFSNELALRKVLELQLQH